MLYLATDLSRLVQGSIVKQAEWMNTRLGRYQAGRSEKANQRITVDNFDHAFRAVEQGVGFCRSPEHIIKLRNRGQLKVLKVEHNEKYQVPLHITLPKGVKTGPAAKCFYELLLSKAAKCQW